MSHHKRGVVFGLIFALVAGGISLNGPNAALGSEIPHFQYKHRHVGAVTLKQRLRIHAYIEDDSGIEQARCYFRSSPDEPYVFIKMTPDGSGNYSGVLPAFTSSLEQLEYLFLWVDEDGQVIRTQPYFAAPGKLHRLRREYLPEPEIFMEKQLEDAAALYEWVEEGATLHSTDDDDHFGMRAGLYDMSGDNRYRFGYFGGFLHDQQRNVTYAVKGYVNFKPTADGGEARSAIGVLSDQQATVQADEPATVQAEEDDGIRWDEATGLSQTAAGYPNVAGDDWDGYFYRTDRRSDKEYITAEITHDGDGNITVRTSRSGQGRKLRGEISRGYSGDVYLVDDYDGEEWTTHSLDESTCAYFGAEDYAWPPSASDTSPPLYRIELTRDPPPQPEEPEPEPKSDAPWLPGILDLLLRK